MHKVEIERKWLLESPPLEQLLDHATSQYAITQKYLSAPEHQTRCIRLSVSTLQSGTTKRYELLTKTEVSPGIHRVSFMDITKEEYQRLSLEAPSHNKDIVKTRYLVPFSVHANELVLEIDRFHAPRRLWVAELEVPSEDLLKEHITLPAWLSSIKEVTGESTYSNENIAQLQGSLTN